MPEEESAWLGLQQSRKILLKFRLK